MRPLFLGGDLSLWILAAQPSADSLPEIKSEGVKVAAKPEQLLVASS
jgi:hypothetical protein